MCCLFTSCFLSIADMDIDEVDFTGKRRHNGRQYVGGHGEGEEYLQSLVDEYTGPRQLEGWEGIIPTADSSSSHCLGDGNAISQRMPGIIASVSKTNLNVQMNNSLGDGVDKKVESIQLYTPTYNSPKAIVASSPMFSQSIGKFNDQNFSLPTLKI